MICEFYTKLFSYLTLYINTHKLMPCHLHVVQVRGPAVHGLAGVVIQEECKQL